MFQVYDEPRRGWGREEDRRPFHHPGYGHNLNYGEFYGHYGPPQGMQDLWHREYYPPQYQPMWTRQPPPPPSASIPAALGAPPRVPECRPPAMGPPTVVTQGPSVTPASTAHASAIAPASVADIHLPPTREVVSKPVVATPPPPDMDKEYALSGKDSAEEGEIEDEEEECEFDFFENSTEESSGTEETEAQDKPNSRYHEQLKKVRKLRKLPSDSGPEEDSETLSGDRGSRKRYKCSLPAPEGFIKYMDEHYIDELKDVKGGKPLAVGTMPKMFKPKMACYEVKEGWSTEYLKEDTALYKSALYRSKDTPSLKMKHDTIRKLETHNLCALNVECYTDNFLWSAKQMMLKIQSRLKEKQYEKEPRLALNGIKEIYGLTEEALLFMKSAARGLQDLSKMTMDEVATIVTVRRDNWIEAMSYDLPTAQKLALRQGKLMEKTLFGKDALETATIAVERARQDKTNQEVKRAVSTNANEGQKGRGQRRTHSDDREEQGGKKQKGNQEKTPYHSFGSSNNKSRGNQRGQRGQRGRGRRGSN